MLVDHWIDFKVCRHHRPKIGDDLTGMKEFIQDLKRLLQQIPQYSTPDFAPSDRLPVGARLPDEPNEEVEDEWAKYSKDLLWHMLLDEGKEGHHTVR